VASCTEKRKEKLVAAEGNVNFEGLQQFLSCVHILTGEKRPLRWCGPGELLPQTWAGYPTGLTWNAVAGMTVVALRATDRVGRCRVTAYSPGLSLGRVEIAVSAKGKRDEIEYRSGADIYK
jgi:hypothetical protein